MSENRELTKKNQDFMFQFKKLLAQNTKLDGKKIDAIVSEVEAKLLATQGQGQTATQLFGTPTQAVQQYLDPKKTAKKLFDFKFSTLAIDTSLAIFMLFALVFGLTLFFSKNNRNQGAGIISLLLIAGLGGSIYTAVVLKLTPNPKAPEQTNSRSRRWGYLIAAMVAWILGFVVLGMLPAVINPTLPAIVYIVLAAVAYLAFRWNRQRAGLKGGFFAISQLSQQARLEAAQK